MQIKLKTLDGKRTLGVDVSKLTKIETISLLVEENFGISRSEQKLFYSGKQLDDHHTLFDYNVKVNEVIQVMQRVAPLPPATPSTSSTPDPLQELDLDSDSEEEESVESHYFKKGDFVYVKDNATGAWDDGKITKICQGNANTDQKPEIDKSKETSQGKVDKGEPSSGDTSESNTKEEAASSVSAGPSTADPIDDGLLYKVTVTTASGSDQEVSVTLADLRPCATRSLALSELKNGMTVLANYNPESFREPGGWYEVEVTYVKVTRTGGDLMGTVKMGKDTFLQGCIINYCHDTKPLSPLVPLEERDPSAQENAILLEEPCAKCLCNPTKKCKECSCIICGGKHDPDQQVLCDECNDAFHISCLTPPLEALPSDNEWFCPGCKRNTSEIVAPGSELKDSKRKSKMPSAIAAATGLKTRDWGCGNATAGVVNKCTIVPIHHFGSIPNVEVGSRWKFRFQAAGSGVHRPPVSGIHGRAEHGAYSLSLNGGYEDDKDLGDTFFYTGSGGRNLSGNKRVSSQSSDQKLTSMNLALAHNCAAPISQEGGNAGANWKKGKPVRVLRGYNLAKHSKYAPAGGFRYDGTYKVVRYFPKVGKSGFKVWRYELRRDDPTPAPWTPAGKKLIKENGLEGYLFGEDENGEEKTKGKGSSKRKADSDEKAPPPKKAAVKAYKPEPQLKALIKEDVNEKLWADCNDTLKQGKLAFMSKVTENFVCVCCQELVASPVTTPCLHNICLACLKRSFDAKVYQCPSCRATLDKNKVTVNKVLSDILVKMFPGYNQAR